MNDFASFRAVERAMDAFRRGETVLLARRGAPPLAVMAAEAWLAAPAPAEILLLSGPRARWLGWQETPAPVRVPFPLPPASVETMVMAHAAPRPARLETASEGDEAALVLAKLAGCLPACVLPGAAAADSLLVSADDIATYRAAYRRELVRLPDIALPVEGAEDARAHAFTERGGQTHLALVIGAAAAQAEPLVRIHSSCVTGDLLGSLRCDCGGQLRSALDALRAEGAGVLLYLNQEGRGIGLAAKLRAYHLQEQGLDTVDANHALGYGEDERDFSLAARMLEALSIRRVRLLTNNPAKIAALEKEGIAVAARAPLVQKAGPHNEAYLATKRARFGHWGE